MKSILQSACVAFTMFTALPAPLFEWKENNLRHMLCFFPLVGAVVGMFSLLWCRVGFALSLQPGLIGAVAALLPVAVTGGLHMDGLADTCDAMGSRREPDKKLEILRDPHIGAFGVAGVAGYLLLSCALWLQVAAAPSLLALAALGFVASRCAGGLAMVLIPRAKQDGLAATFTTGASRRWVVGVCGAAWLAVTAASACASPVWSAAAALGALVLVVLYRRACLREFGGVTGDLIGCLIQLVELVYLTVAALGGAVAIL